MDFFNCANDYVSACSTASLSSVMSAAQSCTLTSRKHPTSGWIIQQLREAFPFEASHKYLILDRDQKFGLEVIAAGGKPQGSLPSERHSGVHGRNGIAERWVGSWQARTCWTHTVCAE